MKALRKPVAALTILFALGVPIVALAPSPSGASSACLQNLWTETNALSNNDLATEKLVLPAYESGSTGTPTITSIATKYKALVKQDDAIVTKAAIAAVQCGLS